jgi:hypothetical protein
MTLQTHLEHRTICRTRLVPTSVQQKEAERRGSAFVRCSRSTEACAPADLQIDAASAGHAARQPLRVHCKVTPGVPRNGPALLKGMVRDVRSQAANLSRSYPSAEVSIEFNRRTRPRCRPKLRPQWPDWFPDFSLMGLALELPMMRKVRFLFLPRYSAYHCTVRWTTLN